MKKFKQKKLGLYLSGGGARAMCFAGVMDALIENGIEIDYIGAHSGAAIMLCYYYSFEDKENLFKEYAKFNFTSFINFRFWKNPLNEKKIIYLLDRITGNLQIEDCPIPTWIYTSDVTDPKHPKKAAFKKGSLGKYALVSSIIPPSFRLFKENNKVYADGAFTSLFSANDLRSRGSDVVVGLFPDALMYTKLPPLAYDLGHIIKASHAVFGEYERQREPVDIEIDDFDCQTGLNDYKDARVSYTAGWKKAHILLPQIYQLLKG